MDFLKKKLYFVAARYFRFWARIALERWSPRVIVVTGSNGKTTLLRFLEAQLGNKAYYSHKANSAFGIPFNLLKMDEAVGRGWLKNALMAPFRAFGVTFDQEFYVAEVDAERPKEAPFLAELLRPEITLWTSSAATHAVFYDAQVKSGKFRTIEEAVAHEYGAVAAATTKLVLFDTSNDLIFQQVTKLSKDINTQPVNIDKKLDEYQLLKKSTKFVLQNGRTYMLKEIMPKAVAMQIIMVDTLMDELGYEPDFNFEHYTHPPGRSSLFKGKKGITILDSAYNSNLGSMTEIAKMFRVYPAEHKWAVIGDMMELGKTSAKQHKDLAEAVALINAEKFILVGPQTNKYTYEPLKKLVEAEVLKFETQMEVLKYIEKEASGNETILFKGFRRMEGVIEHLLEDEKDVEKLAWRGSVWQKDRRRLGF